MEEERYPPSRENPKGAAAAALPPAERPPRPLPSILDRFRAMLCEREEDLRETGEDDPPPPTGEEIVRFYEELLGELTFNSKPIITELTMIAGQYIQFAEGIADAICARVLEVPVDQKLPSLYLLDSIVKNIRGEYVRYFAARLPKVFCQAYNEVHPSQHPAMRHLFGTWSPVFHRSVLHKIEDELQFSPSGFRRTTGAAHMSYPESPPRPSHGIHVNPKYLEAQHQFKHSSVMHSGSTRGSEQMADFEDERMDQLTSRSPKGWSASSPRLHEMSHGRGVSSSLEVYGHQSSAQYRSDFDCHQVLPPRVGMTGAGLPLTSNNRQSIFDVEEPLRHSIKNMQKPLSPGTGLRRPTPQPGDRFSRRISPNRVFERPSPPHLAFGYGPGKLTSQNGRFDKNLALDDGVQPSEASRGHSFNNGYHKQDPRQLIDAYGNYGGDDAPYEKFPKLQRLDASELANDSPARKWISSGEEEYVWEDMSPTLADRSRRSSIPPLGPDPETFTIRAGFPRPGAALLDSDIGRHSWPGQNQLPAIDDPAVNIEDRISIIGSTDGSMNKWYPDRIGIQKGPFPYYQGSHRVQDPAKNYMFPESLQQNPGPLPQVRAPELPPTVNRMPPTGRRLPSPYENSPKNEMLFQRLSSAPSDYLSADTSSIDQHFAQRPHSPVVPAPVEWRPVHKTHAQTLPLVPTNVEHFKSAGETIENNRPSVNQGQNSSLFLHRHPYDAVDRKISNTSRPLQTPYQNSDLVHSNYQIKEEGSLPGGQSQGAYESFVLNMSAQTAPRRVPELRVTNLQARGHGVAVAPVLSGSFSVPSSAVSLQSMPPLHGPGLLPPLPLGPPPPSLQTGPGSQSASSSVASASSSGALSGLLSTLMAQGLISLTPPNQSQDSVGMEFNADLLKVRHESAINALYMELPGQCTTCGLRFKCQEEHGSHMDWHVTKNRISKNSKQKSSRKWFVSAKEWLSGAETLGNDFVPGFLTTDTVMEKKEDKEMAVPADENQTVCALCGEPFEDFYSDETEEWMYKGAVYMNAPGGNFCGLDKSQLGPIVHSKCMSESADASLQV